MALLSLDVFSRSLVASLTTETRRVLDATIPLEARRLSQLTGGNIDFETVTQQAFTWAGRHAAARVTSISESTRDALREIVRNSFDLEGGALSRAQLAGQIQQSIGLSAPQAKALATFRSDLIAQGLTAKQIDQLTNRYSRRMIKHRAQVIAQHEGMTAGNEAQRRLWTESQRQGLLDSETYEREWVGIMMDGRICQVCWDLHGDRAEIRGSYSNGLSGPPEHVKCRCQERIVRKDSEPTDKPPWMRPLNGTGLRPAVPVSAAQSFEEARRKTIAAWVNGSASRRSTITKHAVAREFRLDQKIFERRPWNISDTEIDSLQPTVRRMYEDTQKALADRGIKEVTLWRGWEHGTRDWSVLECFTEEQSVADRFRKRGGANGRIEYTTIPAWRVWMWHDGPGWRNGRYGNQLEWIVLPRRMKKP